MPGGFQEASEVLRKALANIRGDKNVQSPAKLISANSAAVFPGTLSWNTMWYNKEPPHHLWYGNFKSSGATIPPGRHKVLLVDGRTAQVVVM